MDSTLDGLARLREYLESTPWRFPPAVELSTPRQLRASRDAVPADELTRRRVDDAERDLAAGTRAQPDELETSDTWGGHAVRRRGSDGRVADGRLPPRSAVRDAHNAATIIGEAIGLDRAQRARVTAELRAWVARASGSTWDCEACGLRLRGGQSVPGYCTADLYGRLVAVKGDDAGARARLLAAIRKRLPPVAQDWTKRWSGHRAEHTHAEHFTRGVTLVRAAVEPCVAPGIKVPYWQAHQLSGWHALVHMRAKADEKWHLARPSSTQLSPRTWVHSVDPTSHPVVDGLREVGAGPVSVGLVPGEALLVVVPEPGSTPALRAREVLRAHGALRHYAARPVDVRWRCVVADFELV